ncbi:MAG TPA: hypothetical protein VK357_14080 [Rubrobacteraceae bacterium]|nr:hypothetical protein [Rubrobacteraceae bacterium]
MALPLPPSGCSPLLPNDPADQEAATNQQGTSAKREQRHATARWQLCLGSERGDRRRRGGRCGRGSRNGLRSRGRRGRRGLAVGLRDHAASLGLHDPIRAVNLRLGATGLGVRNISRGIGDYRKPILGERRSSGHHDHREHRRNITNFYLLVKKRSLSEADPYEGRPVYYQR